MIALFQNFWNISLNIRLVILFFQPTSLSYKYILCIEFIYIYTHIYNDYVSLVWLVLPVDLFALGIYKNYKFHYNKTWGLVMEYYVLVSLALIFNPVVL